MQNRRPAIVRESVGQTAVAASRTDRQRQEFHSVASAKSATSAQWLAASFVRLFFWKIGHLPRRLSLFLCRLLARLVFAVDRKHRRIGLINLRLAFPEMDERQRTEILKRSFLRLGDLAVELSRMDRLSADECRRRFPYQDDLGLAHYRQARDLGKGVLFLTAHIGPWELLPAAHAAHGHPLSFLVRPLDNPCLDRWLNRRRTRFGNETIDKKNALGRVVRRLREGKAIGFLLDQNVQEKDGVYAPLFGHPAATSSALAGLSHRTGAPVVPGFLCPDGAGGCRVRFYPPIVPPRHEDRARAVRELTASYNQAIERVIREFPDCWLWGHRRFSTQPDGEDLYREKKTSVPRQG